MAAPIRSGTTPPDADRVLRILEQNDGSVQQKQIVEQVGWSKAKVSVLLSEMEDRGEITKLRVGRENVIYEGSRSKL